MRSSTKRAAGACALAVLAGAGLVSLERRAERPPAAPVRDAGDAPPPAAAPAGSAALRPAGVPAVVVYVGEPCGTWCQRQQADLDALGIRYQVRNIGLDEWALRELRLHDRELPVPSIAVGRTLWRGYDPTHAWRVRHELDYLEHGSRLGTDGLVLFTGSSCPFSAKLRADLDRLGVDYEDRVIDRDPEALHQLVRLAGDAGVPVAVWGGDLWPGWSEGRAQEIRDALAR